MFDIKDFYSSITQDLLNKALNFASEYIYISKSDIDVINHESKSLLFDGSHTWIKKQRGLFDVSMGAYDGAEVCEIVGTYMLNVLSKKYNKNDLRLYRDDGLAVLKNKSEPQSEHVKKNIQKIFKEHGLDIIMQCNMKVVNYLDVTFNLNDGTYMSYTKPNNEIKYIHKNSNHPASVIRQIPLSIESRLSTLSFNEKYHKKSFNHVKHKNDTELSKEFWEIKKRNGTPKITWKIIRICRSYNPNSKRCLLCLHENYEIATYKGDNLLNKRNENIEDEVP